MGAVFVITAGTAIASYDEINLSWRGLACMAAAEVAEATKVVLTQLVLVKHNFHPSETPLFCMLQLVRPVQVDNAWSS